MKPFLVLALGVLLGGCSFEFSPPVSVEQAPPGSSASAPAVRTNTPATSPARSDEVATVESDAGDAATEPFVCLERDYVSAVCSVNYPRGYECRGGAAMPPPCLFLAHGNGWLYCCP